MLSIGSDTIELGRRKGRKGPSAPVWYRMGMRYTVHLRENGICEHGFKCLKTTSQTYAMDQGVTYDAFLRPVYFGTRSLGELDYLLLGWSVQQRGVPEHLRHRRSRQRRQLVSHRRCLFLLIHGKFAADQLGRIQLKANLFGRATRFRDAHVAQHLARCQTPSMGSQLPPLTSGELNRRYTTASRVSARWCSSAQHRCHAAAERRRQGRNEQQHNELRWSHCCFC